MSSIHDFFNKTSDVELDDKLKVEIETAVTKKIKRIGTLIGTGVLAAVFGAIITSLWSMNGEVNLLKGKYSSPNEILKYSQTRVDILEKENKDLLEKNYKSKLELLQEEIKDLKKKKNGN